MLRCRQENAAPRETGTRLPASYVNLYVANGGVVAPAFGDGKRDGEARAVLQKAFPDREVTTVVSAATRFWFLR